MVKKCKCGDYRSDAAAYQNEKYGDSMRVFNPRGGKNRGGYRCTVCGEVTTGGSVASPKAPAKEA